MNRYLVLSDKDTALSEFSDFNVSVYLFDRVRTSLIHQDGTGIRESVGVFIDSNLELLLERIDEIYYYE